MKRPYKLPRRRTYEVLTSYIRDPRGRTERLFFTKVKASSPDDALSQFKTIVTYCGEPIVNEVFE
jgi:hypothetical protein